MARAKKTPRKSDNKRRSAATQMMRVGKRTYKVKLKLLRTIRNLQRSTEHCIPKAPFSRLIREIFQGVARDPDIRVQSLALQALQEAAEVYVVGLFEDCCLTATHAGRLTVRPTDMELVLILRGQPSHL